MRLDRMKWTIQIYLLICLARDEIVRHTYTILRKDPCDGAIMQPMMIKCKPYILLAFIVSLLGGMENPTIVANAQWTNIDRLILLFISWALSIYLLAELCRCFIQHKSIIKVLIIYKLLSNPIIKVSIICIVYEYNQ